MTSRLIRSMHTSHSNHYNATLGMHTGSFAFAPASIGIVAELRAGHARTRTCLRFWCWPRRCPTPERRFGPPISCPEPIRGRGSCRVPNPCAKSDAAGARRKPARTGTGALRELERRASCDAQEDLQLAARIKAFRNGTRHADRNARRARSGRANPTKRWPLWAETRAERRFWLAVPGGPPAGGTGRAICRADPYRFEQQLGFARQHGRPRSAGAQVDQPIAGLLQDLKQRGMMDDVLVVWTTEFGRTPFNDTADARAASITTGHSRPGWRAPA